jgi:hypothetical protein
MENRMGHAQNHRIGKLRRKGSATVEALIVLPVFMVVMLTLVYIIRVFFVYSTMQSALQTVARNISSASYYYYVSGLKDYSERLGEAAQKPRIPSIAKRYHSRRSRHLQRCPVGH